MSKKVFKAVGLIALGVATYGIITLAAGPATLAAVLASGEAVLGTFAIKLSTLALTGLTLLGASNSLKVSQIDVGRELDARLDIATDPTAARKIIVGELAIAGTLRYRNDFDLDGKKVTWFVLALAGHPIDSIQGFRLNGESVTIPGSGGGAVTSGTFANKLWVYYRDGRATDAAFPEIATDETSALGSSPWGAKSRIGRGIPSAAIKIISGDVFRGRLEPEFRVRGSRMYDPRLDSTVGGSGPHRWNDETTFEWSNVAVDQLANNPIIARLNYLRGFYWPDSLGTDQLIAGRGLLSEPSKFDFSHWIAQANICDEDVAVVGGGTINRYTANGIIDPQKEHEQVLSELDTADGGNTLYSGGQYWAYPAAWRAPSLTFTDADIIGVPSRVDFLKSPSTRVNVVRGGFADETNDYRLKDYPAQKDDASIARIGPVQMTLNFPFTTDHRIAQRIASISMRRQNASKRLTGQFTHRALKLAPGGETLAMTYPLYQFSAQPMRIAEWAPTFIEDKRGRPGIGVEMTLAQDEQAYYTWTAGTDEQSLDAPTSLPSTSTYRPVETSYALAIDVDLDQNASVGEGCIVGVDSVGLPDFTKDGSIRWNGSRISIPRDAGDNLTFVGGGIGARKAFILFDTSKPATPRFTANSQARHVVIAYRDVDGQWYYDTNGSRQSFTPIRNRDVALGWLEVDGDDIIDGGIFGQPIALELAPEAAATEQADWSGVRGAPHDLMFDTFNYLDQNDLLGRWKVASGSLPETSFLTGLTDAPGGRAVRFGNNSGNDQVWLWRPDLLQPYDPNSLYEVGAVARRSAGSGNFHCGLVGVAADGVTLINTAGADQQSSQHYLAASGLALGGSWTIRRGYAKGHSASPSASNKTDPKNPGQMHDGVVFVAPLIIANYRAAAGQTDVAAVWVRRIPGGLSALDGDSDIDALLTTNGPAEAGAEENSGEFDFISSGAVPAVASTTDTSSMIGQEGTDRSSGASGVGVEVKVKEFTMLASGSMAIFLDADMEFGTTITNGHVRVKRKASGTVVADLGVPSAGNSFTFTGINCSVGEVFEVYVAAGETSSNNPAAVTLFEIRLLAVHGLATWQQI